MSDIALDGIEPIQGLFQESAESQDRPLTPVEESTNMIASQILNLDPAREMINTGALFEMISTKQIESMETESNKYIASIDLLLDLSKEATSLNAENPKLTQTFRDLVQKLKENGFNLIQLEDGKEIDKEQLSALKTMIGSHIDKLRTKLQQIFTKMQTVIQNMSSVNDSVKKMLTEQSDLIRKVLERCIKR